MLSQNAHALRSIVRRDTARTLGITSDRRRTAAVTADGVSIYNGISFDIQLVPDIREVCANQESLSISLCASQLIAVQIVQLFA